MKTGSRKNCGTPSQRARATTRRPGALSEMVRRVPKPIGQPDPPRTVVTNPRHEPTGDLALQPTDARPNGPDLQVLRQVREPLSISGTGPWRSFEERLEQPATPPHELSADSLTHHGPTRV